MGGSQDMQAAAAQAVGFAALLRDYDVALGWVADLAGVVVTGVTAGGAAGAGAGVLDGSTPCGDWTVRLLLGHLIGTARRGLATAAGTPVAAAPHVVTDVPDAELASTYRDLAAQVRAAWSAVASADERVRAPWGECTARDAVRGFIVETLVHGWDLATVLHPAAQAVLAPTPVEEAAARALPAVNVPDRLRGTAYADPVQLGQAPAGATALTRLAAMLGHQRPDVVIRPIRPERLPEFIATAQTCYAQQRSTLGGIPAEEAEHQSRVETAAMFPHGALQPGHAILQAVGYPKAAGRRVDGADAPCRLPATREPIELDPLQGDVLGAVWVGPHRSEPGLAFIYDIAVEPAVRGQGIARRLLSTAEAWARARDCHAISLHVFAGNERAIGLYENSGYHATDILMRRPLPPQ